MIHFRSKASRHLNTRRYLTDDAFAVAVGELGYCCGALGDDNDDNGTDDPID